MRDAGCSTSLTSRRERRSRALLPKQYTTMQKMHGLHMWRAFLVLLFFFSSSVRIFGDVFLSYGLESVACFIFRAAINGVACFFILGCPNPWGFLPIFGYRIPSFTSLLAVRTSHVRLLCDRNAGTVPRAGGWPRGRTWCSDKSGAWRED